MSIYESSVKRPIMTALCFVAIVVIGLFSLSRLSIDLLPHIETNQIMVLTGYPGASAADIETNVTKPLENILNTVSDLKHVSSESRENMSVVTLEYNYGTDVDEATNDVRDKLDMVRSQLPDDISNPIIFKFGTDDIPILMLSVTAKESLPALYRILDDQVASPLQRISGVGAVSISGAPVREIQVYCDPQKLEAYHLSIEAISAIIANENRNTPAGTVDFGSNTYSLRVEGEFLSSQSMNNLVIGSWQGRNIYLRDVARIVDTTQERAQEAYNNGVQGGMIVIQKQSGANSVDIARKVHEKLPELQKTLPTDVELGVIIDTSVNIQNTIDSLIETILVTFLVVMLVVLVFLGRWRATFIIVLTIPISLIASFIYLQMTGNTLNIISLSSLSIAIGMVVDDAIVVLENITTHMERGSSPKQAAVHGTNEVALSVIASTLTVLAVFLPLTTISGLSGVLFAQLGWSVSIVMIVSTVAALTLTPMLASQMFQKEAREGKKKTPKLFVPIEKGLDSLDNGYAWLLGWAVRHRAAVIVIAAAIFGSSLLLLGVVKSEFFPTQDNGRIAATIELPVGTRMEITRDVALRLDREWRAKYPEITVTHFSVGQADTDNAWASMSDNGSNIASFYVSLTSKADRTRGLQEICDMMREDLKAYPEIKTSQIIVGGGGMMSGAELEVEVYGYDFGQTDAVAQELTNRMMQIEGVAEVNISRQDYVPEYQIDFDREKLSMHGLNVTTASMYLRNRITGTTASYYREEGEEYDIKVRYAPEFRQSIEDIENILIYNPQGEGIRLSELGKVVERFTPPTIERKDRERVVKLTGAMTQGYALSEVVAQIQANIGQMEIPQEVTVTIGGAFEDQQESFGDLFLLMIMIIILVYIVMAAQFESFTYPFIIMFSLPFAFSGVFIGLAVSGTALSVMALIGLIMLAGIVVKNGIVLVDYTNLNRERGMSIMSAVVDAGKSRLRPVLMTSLTTILGMLPLALGQGEGSEMWRPMGVAVWTGLAFSTFITLVLIPVVYCIFAGTGVKRRRKQMAETLDLLPAEGE